MRRKQGFPNEKRLKSYPAVKLCRLAVDKQAWGNQIGSGILDYIKSMFVINNKTGCRFITVDAYLAAVPFYEKNGFRMMNQEDNVLHCLENKVSHSYHNPFKITSLGLTSSSNVKLSPSII